MKKIFIFIFCILLITGCNKPVINNNLPNNSDATKIKEEYEKLNNIKDNQGNNKYLNINIKENNPIKYITDEQVISLLEEQTGIIYFGFSDCPWCRSLLPTLIDVALKNSIKEIYYFNPKEIRNTIDVDLNNNLVTTSKGSENYFKIVKLLESYLDDYIVKDSEGNKINTNQKRLTVPMIIAVKNGKILSYHSGTLDTHNPKNHLNEEEYNILYETIDKLIKTVYNEDCDC